MTRIAKNSVWVVLSPSEITDQASLKRAASRREARYAGQKISAQALRGLLGLEKQSSRQGRHIWALQMMGTRRFGLVSAAGRGYSAPLSCPSIVSSPSTREAYGSTLP